MQHATAVARGCAGVDAMVPLGPTEWIVEADEAVGRSPLTSWARPGSGRVGIPKDTSITPTV